MGFTMGLLISFFSTTACPTRTAEVAEELRKKFRRYLAQGPLADQHLGGHGESAVSEGRE